MSDIVIASGWRSRLEELVGSKRQTALLAAALLSSAVIGIVVAGGRAPAQVAPPATSSAPAPAPSPASPTVAPPLFVHVSGAVVAPGLYELAQGMRVADAIESAGGAVRRADLDALNLAELLVDGAKVHVPLSGEIVAAGVDSVQASPSPAPIDVNTADALALEAIPGIGPTRAAAIIAYRDEVGGFRSVDQLLEVQGIGPATLEAMREHVIV